MIPAPDLVRDRDDKEQEQIRRSERSINGDAVLAAERFL
jgi:hypothetical protein